MLAQLARTLTEWHCNSFTDLMDEMELWDWNVANKDFLSRLAKSLHSHKVSVTWAGKMDKKLASVCVLLCFVDPILEKSRSRCHSLNQGTWGGRIFTLHLVLVLEKMSWATATWSIKKCQTRIQRIGGSRVDTEPTAWGLDVQV